MAVTRSGVLDAALNNSSSVHRGNAIILLFAVPAFGENSKGCEDVRVWPVVLAAVAGANDNKSEVVVVVVLSSLPRRVEVAAVAAVAAPYGGLRRVGVGLALTTREVVVGGGAVDEGVARYALPAC